MLDMEIFIRKMSKKVYYSPSNFTEFLFFLENNCLGCKNYNAEMHWNRDINTCDILFKILDQQGLAEEDCKEIYYFSKDELDIEPCPAKCLKRREK
jgi:hypothetical protein